MKHYTTKINKIKVKNIPRLCTILRGCDQFVISSGNYRLETASLLMMMSLIGLRNGFNLDIYNYDTERQKFIIREIEALKKIL